MSRIICINRESGSNGRVIARMTADRLGIPCYDKELLIKAAEESGIAQEILEEADERKENPMLYTAVTSGKELEYYGRSPNDVLYTVQKEVILDLAEKGDCIFVGRCADDILRKNTGHKVISVFIAASREYRIHTVMERDGLDEKTAAGKIRRTDRRRKAYYYAHTDKDWGVPSEYEISFSSSLLSEYAIADMIATMYKEMSRTNMP